MAKIVVLGSHPESLLHFRADMMRAMAQHNEVIACVPDLTPLISLRLQELGVKGVEVQLSRTGLNPLADLATIWQLYKLFKQLKPAQVFAYTSKPVIFGSIAARLAGVKQIYSMITGLGSYFIHTDFKSKLVNKVMCNLYKLALKFNTKVFFQNTDDIAEFKQLGIFADPARTVLTNGSGVNLDYFTPLPVPERIGFLLTARFILAKGILEYLAAAEQIKQQYPQVDFYLVGWFEDKDEAIDRAVIEDAVARGTIINLGKLDDVRPALAKSSVFVLPSYREGTPKGVLEAMACGRAILTTDVPGCRETVISGENGLLVPARDVEGLRHGLEQFILNPSWISSMGQKSRAIATDKYDVNKVNAVILTAMGQLHG